MGRMPTRPQPSTSQEHTIGKSALAPITGQVFWITALLFGQNHNQSCIVSSPVEEIKKHVTPLHNYKAFWAVNCSVWNAAPRSDSFSVDINDGIPSEVALPRTTFVVFELSAVELGWVKSWRNNSELVNILRPLWVRRQRKKVVSGVECEFHFIIHMHTLRRSLKPRQD